KSQVKDKNIDLLVQQYEQFVISKDEPTDSVFARFNTIITSLKALDEGYSSKNYVRKFLCALHPKWISKSKGERRFLALKGKKESGDEECSTSESEDEEYALAVRDFKKFFKRRGRCGDPNHLIRECPKPPKDKNRRAFIGGSWNDSGEKDDEKAKDETCLMAQASSEVCFESSYFSDDISWVDDIKFDIEYYNFRKTSLKIIFKNKQLKRAKRKLEKELSELKEKLSKLQKNKGVNLECINCQLLKIDKEKFLEETFKLTQFEKSTHSLNEMLSNPTPSRDKLGLGFNSFEASSSRTKEIKF
ncbi:hypothetical protein Tco_1495393, partial [Tanacetum coccineum]